MKIEDQSILRRVREVGEEMAIERGHAVTIEQAARAALERGLFTDDERAELQLEGIEQHLVREFPGLCPG